MPLALLRGFNAWCHLGELLTQFGQSSKSESRLNSYYGPSRQDEVADKGRVIVLNVVIMGFLLIIPCR